MSVDEPFDSHRWHDNAIHAFRIEEGPDGRGGVLILDIDFIVEWLPPNEGDAYSFRVAPADLRFDDVDDLVIDIDYTVPPAALCPLVIGEIQREAITFPGGRSSFAWTIQIHWPKDSVIRFTSPSLTQTLRSEPVGWGAQWLAPAQRPR